jgi:hypothetical protein
MSATLSRIAALMLFVWTPLPVRADKIDTEHLFAFTIGTDPGELGEKEIEGQSTGRFGKRDGSYTGLSQVLSAEFTPVENLRLEVSAASIYHDIAGVSGLDDRRRGGWQALSVDVRYRLLDREQTSFGLLIDAEPRWGRIDETNGEPVNQYGIVHLVILFGTGTLRMVWSSGSGCRLRTSQSSVRDHESSVLPRMSALMTAMVALDEVSRT